MGSLLLFSIGSVLCGAATNLPMLIAGRGKFCTWLWVSLSVLSTHFCASLAVQGAGGGGIFSSGAIILSDIVSLAERGAFNGILQLCVLRTFFSWIQY